VSSGSQYASCCSAIRDRAEWGLKRQIRPEHYTTITGFSHIPSPDVIEYSSACPNVTYFLYKPNSTSSSEWKTWSMLNPKITPPARTVMSCEIEVDDCKALWDVWEGQKSTQDDAGWNSWSNTSDVRNISRDGTEKGFVDFPLCAKEPREPCVTSSCAVWADHVSIYFEAVSTTRDMCATARQTPRSAQMSETDKSCSLKR
jgi:hypothetical protein